MQADPDAAWAPLPAASRRRCDALFALVLLAGLLAALCGQRDLPLDGHEVLVARTSAEMQRRDDWLVPWFNEAPRLEKPPLSYWLTGVVAGLSGSDGHVLPWQARAVSVLAGLALLGSVYVMGIAVGRPEAGVLGAGVLAGSVAFFSFTHDARPDMLYAGLCGMAVAAFLLAARRDGHGGWLAAMWVAFALATLAKGPQLPGMLLLAMLVHLLLAGHGARGSGRRLALLPGLAVYLLFTLPWWLAIRASLGPGLFASSQLSGTLLRPDPGGLLDPYYAWRPLELLLPWLLLIPPALAQLARRDRWRHQRQLLALCWLVPALLLSAGPQKRWFYMLPALAPACLWLGMGLTGLQGRWQRWFWSAHALLLTVLSGYLLGRTPAAPMAWAATGGGLALLAILLVRLRRGHTPALPMQVAVLVLASAFFAALGQSPLPWSADRYHKRELGLIAHAQRLPGEPMAAWAVTPQVYVYYADSPITRLQRPAEVLPLAGADSALVLVPGSRLGELAALGSLRRLASVPYDDHDTTVLARFRAR